MLPRKGTQETVNTTKELLVPGKVVSGILPEEMKTAVDSKLRDNRAAFRQDTDLSRQNNTPGFSIRQDRSPHH